MDKILFGMPEDPELFLAALSLVQDYQNQLLRQVGMELRVRDDWYVAAHIPNPALAFLTPCLWTYGECDIVDEYRPNREEWQYVFQFEEEPAYLASIPTYRHVTDMWGVMSGTSPLMVPNLFGARIPKTKLGDILLLPWGEEEILAEQLEYNHPEAQVGIFAGGGTWEQQLQMVAGYEVVIGPRSFMTYAAAALKKHVVELYATDKHYMWLGKWSSGLYSQVWGDEFPVELVWRALEAKWKDFSRIFIPALTV